MNAHLNTSPLHLTRRSILHTILCLTLVILSSCKEKEYVSRSVQTHDQINQSILQGLSKPQTIAVMGHNGQDPDAVCSAISMAGLLQQLGIDAKPYLQEKPILSVRYVLDYLGVSAPEVKTTIDPGMPLLITDHNDFLQSVGGAQDAKIVGVVDHHAVSSNFMTASPLYSKFMPVGSANTIVYTIYQDCGLTPSQEMARVMVAGIIADTDSLSKSTTTLADTLCLTQLVEIAKLPNLSELTQGIYEAAHSYIGMTDEEIFVSDMKRYDIAGRRVILANAIGSKEFPGAELCRRMTAVMPAMQQKENAYLLLMNIIDGHHTHMVYCGTDAKELAEEAFGKTTHDSCIELDRPLVRKSDVVPAVTKVLSR